MPSSRTHVRVHDAIPDEDRHRLLIESIKDYAIYMLTPEGIVTSWNSGAQRFKGYTAEEIVGQSFERFYTPEDRAAGLPKRLLAIAASQGRCESEGWRVRKDGTRFWAHVIIDPVIDDNGHLIGFAKITRDLTQQKLNEDALKLSEQRFRFLVKGVTDYAIYMLSPEGEITNWNTGAERIKGYTDREVLGTHFSRFYTPEDIARGKPARALETARREGRFESEGWRVRKDGTRFWAHVVIDPVYDDAGEMIGFAKITRDVTEKRRAEEILEEARAALVQSQKMEAIGRLTGGIAHDFNNLLAGIMGNLDLLRLRLEAGQTDGLRPHLDAAMAAARRSASLTHRLLAYARRQTLTRKPVDASMLAQSMMDLLQRTVGPAIEMRADLDDAVWWVLCDQNQLESALLNLVINARDAMPDGGHITVRTRNLSADEAATHLDVTARRGEYVELAVEDDGTGMTPDVIEHAFEPFFTTKPFGEGTGLGLSMVHGFINQSGGQVGIASSAGVGTTVSLYLPRYAESHAATAATAPPRQETPASGDHRRLTVLVVDDEDAVRKALVDMLALFGHDTLAAADGREALTLLESADHVDLLVTDIGLPGGMNGRQLAGAARDMRPSLNVLFITGYADPSVLGGETLPDGMRVLVKPFTVERFIEIVDAMTSTAEIDIAPGD